MQKYVKNPDQGTYILMVTQNILRKNEEKYVYLMRKKSDLFILLSI